MIDDNTPITVTPTPTLHTVNVFNTTLYFYAGVWRGRITTELYYTREQAESVTGDTVRVIRVRRGYGTD